MISDKEKYRIEIMHRLEENWKSFNILFELKHYGNCISIMCQELDQYVRILYLIKQSHFMRDDFIKCSVNDQKWHYSDSDNKKKYVTDDDIRKFASKLDGWELSIVEFGYVFKHLSSNLNYVLKDPIKLLDKNGRNTIRKYVMEYHNIDLSEDYSINDLILVLPEIFKKISRNIEDYLMDLR